MGITDDMALVCDKNENGVLINASIIKVQCSPEFDDILYGDCSCIFPKSIGPEQARSLLSDIGFSSSESEKNILSKLDQFF